MDRAQENNEKFNPQSGNNSTTQPIGDRVGKINQACGSIGMAKTKCDSVVAARNGVEALSVLGGDADRFCRAVSRIAMGVEMPCKDVMPKLFG
jgi:hypothetical protein